MDPHKARLRERLQDALGDAYAIERELGGAGMSRVFVARETTLGRHVVVKALPPEMSGSLVGGRFRREVQLIAQLRHPHVVPLLTAGESGRLLYYTMPYVAGESLRARLDRDGAFPAPEAARLLREIADALAYAHGRGVVHRDLKPDNILLADGHVLIVDFGIAKALQASADAESPADANPGRPFTSAGVALGTPAYMSPEQAAADPQVDHRADLYALGVVAYEMLAGRHPFAGRAPQAMLAAHVTEVPGPLRGVAPALAALVTRLLEKRPADRPQTAAEVRRALDAIALTPAGVGAVTEPHPRPGPGESARRLPGGVRAWVVAALCAATLALGLALGLWIGRR